MENFETKAGVVIAIFAALMAVSDLFAGKYGDDEIIGTNEKAAAYQWYQSKSIKQSLVEGEQALLKTLLKSGSISISSTKGIEEHVTLLDKKINKYDKEKKEILLGSSKVGKENWAQDVEGELGKVVGAKEIEENLTRLSSAGDKFDVATLFFQMSLVVGAISLVLKKEKVQLFFFYTMICFGMIGTSFTTWALYIVGLI